MPVIAPTIGTIAGMESGYTHSMQQAVVNDEASRRNADPFDPRRMLLEQNSQLELHNQKSQESGPDSHDTGGGGFQSDNDGYEEEGFDFLVDDENPEDMVEISAGAFRRHHDLYAAPLRLI